MTHGGARPGAGRKACRPEERRVQVGARVTPAVYGWLTEQAEVQGVSVGRIIEELVDSFIKECEKEGE